jgi:hypothetical protein
VVVGMAAGTHVCFMVTLAWRDRGYAVVVSSHSGFLSEVMRVEKWVFNVNHGGDMVSGVELAWWIVFLCFEADFRHVGIYSYRYNCGHSNGDCCLIHFLVAVIVVGGGFVRATSISAYS